MAYHRVGRSHVSMHAGVVSLGSTDKAVGVALGTCLEGLYGGNLTAES